MRHEVWHQNGPTGISLTAGDENLREPGLEQGDRPVEERLAFEQQICLVLTHAPGATSGEHDTDLDRLHHASVMRSELRRYIIRP